MKTQRVGYVRVSTADQNDSRQLEGIHVDRVFSEKISAKDANRPQLQAAISYVREGDTLVVHSMDRLARNVEDMLRIVRELNAKGVAVEFVKESMFFAGGDEPRSIFTLTILSAVSQFERALIKERQREGIEIAKAKGIYKGRKPVMTPQVVAWVEALVAGGMPKAQAARKAGVTRQALYSYYARKARQAA